MESLHPPSSSSSATVSVQGTTAEGRTCHLFQIGDDLLENILAKLPAKSFASAACVNRSWNSVCARFLSHPKFASALSLNSNLPEAVEEVVAEVLSEPIRPHFAILYVNRENGLKDAYKLLLNKFGRSVPTIACQASGMIGRDVFTGQIKEAQAENDDAEDGMLPQQSGGIMLTVGYLPGIKVKLVPLIGQIQEPWITRFALDIREFSASDSGCSSPEAVIIFGDPCCDLKPVLFTLDHALSAGTIIVGDEAVHFVCMYGNAAAAALVFCRDKYKPNGLGEIQFHYALSSGIVEVGNTYKAVSVKVNSSEQSTWLTAKTEGGVDILDGNQILDDIAEVGSDLYIGVRKRRKSYMIDSEKVKSVTSLEFHPVLGGDEEYLYVHGRGIKTGDLFQFQTPSVDKALASTASVSLDFQKLAEDLDSGRPQNAGNNTMMHHGREKVFGAFVFACCGRGEAFFGRPNVDISPVVDNFPGVPVAGVFCGGEIGRGPLASSRSEDRSAPRCPLHVYSTVYLLMSFKP